MEIITLKKTKIITLTGGVNVIILAQIWENFGFKFWQFWEPQHFTIILPPFNVIVT
jgi:hypothetical protein